VVAPGRPNVIGLLHGRAAANTMFKDTDVVEGEASA
jgi:hypothetical protein